MLVPLISGTLSAVCFVPLFVLELWAGNPISTMWVGLVVLGGTIAWLGYRAFTSPFTMRIDGQKLILKSLLGERAYTMADIADWMFMTTENPPSKIIPESNAVLRVKFNDGRNYRGEVTLDEARDIARRLGSINS